MKIWQQILKITGVFKGQGSAGRRPKRRVFDLICRPFEIRGEIGPEKQFSGVLRLAGKQFKKGRLNQSPLMMSVLRPGVGKHQICIVDLNRIRNVGYELLGLNLVKE